MEYFVEFRSSVWKNVKNVSRKELIKIKRKIDEISHNLPDPSTIKMSGNNPFHKIRTGNYRVIYDDRLVILVVKIGHRKDVYRNL